MPYRYAAKPPYAPYGCCAGRGAWQGWTYEAQVVNNSTTVNMTRMLRRSVQGTGVTLAGLLADSVYHVRVRACSTAGCGPWSSNFTAQTLASGTPPTV